VQGTAGHPGNRVVDPKRIIGKNGGQGGGEAQGVADPPKVHINRRNDFFVDFENVEQLQMKTFEIKSQNKINF
jgi:hypothetical protein